MKRATSILLLVILTIAAWGGEPAKNFTAMEINHIRVKTPGLFSAHKSFSLHLDSLQDNEFCFPLSGGKLISSYGGRCGHILTTCTVRRRTMIGSSRATSRAQWGRYQDKSK